MVSQGSVRGPLGGWEQLVTSANETIRVEVTERELAIVVEASNGQRLGRAAIPYPMAGYGGHELVLSAHERYLAMYLYSGQSEVGYEVFSFRPELRHLGGFPYEEGEGFGPAISPDERLIALAWGLNTGFNLTELPGMEDATETSAELVVDWGRLRVEELPNGPATTCSLLVSLPAGYPVESDDSLYPEELEVLDGHVRFRTTWGELVRVPLPLPESVIIPGPSAPQ